MGTLQNFERITGFGRAQSGVSHVLRPESSEELEELLRSPAKSFPSLGLRGAGMSYGDAALNSGGTVLDLSHLKAIRDWSPDTGLVRVEPGVTIEDLWRAVLPDGYWPTVVPGTMQATIGGAVSMNVHGKNCFAVGPIGDHIESLSVALPTGEWVECGPERNPDLFEGVVGGFGMLGFITDVTLRLKRVYSGSLRVWEIPVGSLREMTEVFDEHGKDADYLVGWCDAFAKGPALGRGAVHRANYIPEGHDTEPGKSLRADYQDLPRRILGVLPRERIWPLMRPLLHRPGMRLVNAAKAYMHRLHGSSRTSYLQPHAAFHFLLDYVPDWIRAYGKHGLIQIQPFLPKDVAVDAMLEILSLARRRGLPPYLVVFKKHRPDRFLLSHGVDGYSLAMDFPAGRRKKLWKLAREIQRITLDAGGRFYFAKDSTLTPEDVQRSYPSENLQTFLELKRKCDPEAVLQTNLSRRVWPELSDPGA
jgi:FAD/FMN-containing dehydrogenase